jgi:hypothetical protein
MFHKTKDFSLVVRLVISYGVPAVDTKGYTTGRIHTASTPLICEKTKEERAGWRAQRPGRSSPVMVPLHVFTCTLSIDILII